MRLTDAQRSTTKESFMPFYLRKSLRFGPIRFNLSKSGVGVSAGIKGFRIGSGPRGNYVHMGRGGLYYRATLPSTTQRQKGGTNFQDSKADRESYSAPEYQSGGIVMEEIDSGDIGNIVDSSSKSLINEINEKKQKVRIVPFFLIIGIIAAILIPLPADYKVLIFLSTLVLSIPLAIYDKNRKTTVIFYDIESEAEHLFRGIYDAFEKLSQSMKIWHISAKGNINDSKYHAGANQAVNRKEIKIGFENPKFIKTNISTPSIPVGSQTIYFFPDKILIFDKNKVGGLSYKSAKFSIGLTHFVEEEKVPRDSRIVDHTWRYVNKRGGPDKRFKDNYQIPIAEYETVHLASESGLNELIHISNIGRFARVNEAVKEIMGMAN